MHSDDLSLRRVLPAPSSSGLRIGGWVRSVLLTGASIFVMTGAANAQSVINICSGVSATLPTIPTLSAVPTLPSGTVTAIGTLPILGLGGLSLDSTPITSQLNNVVNGVNSTLVSGINTNVVNALNTNVIGQLSGRPLSVSALDPNGNLVTFPSTNCSLAVANPRGITLGGGQIDGLGGTGNPTANAGAASAIALGNGSSTAAGVAGAVAVGTGASTTTAGGVALGAGSVASRPNAGTELFTGTALRTTIGAVSVGSATNERQITNVAGGTQATDAVNLRQLQSVGTGLAGSLGGGASFSTATGAFTQPGYVIGGTTYRDVGSALAALGSGTTPPTPTPVSGLVAQATPTSPITVGAATGGTEVNIRGTVGDRVLTGVAAGRVVEGSTDAVNGGQVFGLTRNTVQYDTDPGTGRRLNSVTLAGADPNTPVLVRNVATGMADTDAANTGQVKQAVADSKAYTDQQIANLTLGNNSGEFARLRSDIREVRREARQAAAVGLAAGSLRYDDRPGKLSLAAGGGAWRGEAGAAFGIGYTTPDGLARLNAAASTAGGEWGVGGGVSITLN